MVEEGEVSYISHDVIKYLSKTTVSREGLFGSRFKDIQFAISGKAWQPGPALSGARGLPAASLSSMDQETGRYKRNCSQLRFPMILCLPSRLLVQKVLQPLTIS